MRYRFPVLTPKDAINSGYVSLTMPYAINSKDDETRDRERQWFRSVLTDMEGADVVLVEFAPGIEVWRHKRELNIDPRTGVRVSGNIIQFRRTDEPDKPKRHRQVLPDKPSGKTLDKRSGKKRGD